MLRSDWGKKRATSSKGIKTTVLLLTRDLSHLRQFESVKAHQTTGWTCGTTPRFADLNSVLPRATGPWQQPLEQEHFTRRSHCHVGTAASAAATWPLLHSSLFPGQRRLGLALAAHHSFMSEFYEPGFRLKALDQDVVCVKRYLAPWQKTTWCIEAFSEALCSASAESRRAGF